jgi:2-phosphosulfolactate phosphatase
VKTVIHSCLSGADSASGIVVIIDVFRASNTILMLLSRMAAYIIPVATIHEALALKERYPGCLLAGERGGVKVPGFDLGNSPHEASCMELKGKGIIFTTSAGTRGMIRAEGAERILVGSFGNAKALAAKLTDLNPPLVTCLAVGTDGIMKASEDELCAVYLKGTLEGRPQDFVAMKTEIMRGEGAQRLRRLSQELDFSYCLTPDLFDFVPEVKRRRGSLRIQAES